MTMITRDEIVLNNGKMLSIRPIDASKLYIDSSNAAYLTINRNADYEITSVLFEDQNEIKLNDQIVIQIGLVQSIYQIKAIIIDKKQTSVILFSSLPSKTTTFLLPLLNKSKQELKTDSYFVNAFISDNHEYLCLLYRYTGTNLYKLFEEKILKERLCVKHIEYDKYHVMYLFKIPSEFRKDVEHFLEGKYSKFSDTLKKQILKFYGGAKENAISQIVNKSPELKKLIEKDLKLILPDNIELASKPIIEQEIYTINNERQEKNKEHTQ